MGAWGKGSFENDTALDFVGELFNLKAIKKLFNRKNTAYHVYDECRVLAEIVVHLHKLHRLWFDQEIIDNLIEALELIITDNDWFDTWRDERDAKDIKKHIKSLIKRLKTLDGY